MARKNNFSQKDQQKKIARERIRVLFAEAETTFSKNPTLAHRYVDLATKIAMRVKLRFPPEIKRRFCKHCRHYLMPGVNSRIRTRGGKVIISCLDCKNFVRIPIR